MNRTYLHLLYAVAWLLTSTVAIVIFAVTGSIPSDHGATKFISQVGSAIWIVGFAVIFFSWARQDAIQHGRSPRVALVFALLWPFLLFLSNAAYLLYTRGWQLGLLAVLKFFCFLLAIGIVWLSFFKLVGAIL